MENEMKIRERIAALEQDEKSVHRRLDNLEKLVESVHIIAVETKAMREDINNMELRVDEIERKPQKRYETVITSILTTVCGALVGAVIGYFIK